MSEHKTDWKALRTYCKKLMMTQNVPEDEAELVAAHLVEAELMGTASHGVSRTGIYLKRLTPGIVNAKFAYEIENETAASVLWNGCNSMGMVTGVWAMARCIEKARESGCCFIAVKNSNHFGMAGYYARLAAEAGMIGVCGTNAPPNIAPWGSSTAYMGTNPLAIAAPREGEPMVLDMAPSVVAMGKVILAAKLGERIPEGWAITKDGRPTTDPNEGMKGTVLPIGGPKGYGLSLFMDILCGVLSGSQFGPYLGNMWNDFKNPQNIGHIFFAVDISKFTAPEAFKSMLEKMIRDIKSLPRNPGVDEIFIPGEIELRKKNANMENGISLPDTVYEELLELGRTYGVKPDI